MKNRFSAEKLIYISLISVFCIIAAVTAFKIHATVSEINSVTAVIIHDVTLTLKEDRDKKTVYITPSGNKYHLDGCSYLGENKISATREEAKKAGFESCSKCQP